MDSYRGASTGSSILPSDDGLAKLAEMFVARAGKELSEEGVQALMFLQANGSRDVARDVLEGKSHMAGVADIRDFSDKFSPAAHAKDMMAHQNEAIAKRMG